MSRSSLAAVIALLFSCIGLSAQDVHLSQFYTAQLNLNPALGGNYDGDYRVAGNYRNQWREINDPITTAMIAFDKKIPFFSDEINAGILVIQDQFAGFDLNTSKVMLSTAYRKQLGYHTLSAGVQVGMTFKSTDLQGQTFPNQWVYETGSFDPTVTSLEDRLQVSQNYFDLNAGISWSRVFSKFKPTVGMTLFHINRPTDTFSDVLVEDRSTRKVVHADAQVALKSDLSLRPVFMYMWTTKAQDMVVGGLVGKQLENTKVQEIYGGMLFRGGVGRNPDAIIPTIGMKIDNLDLGLSYDVNISELSGSQLKSTIEFSLIYTAPSFSPKLLSIPCDRF